MKDVLGQEISIGCKVAFPAPFGHSLLKGVVVKIGERNDHEARWKAEWDARLGEKVCHWFHIKVEDEGREKDKVRKVGDTNKIVRLN